MRLTHQSFAGLTALWLATALSSYPAYAIGLEFPGPATPTGERREGLTSYRLPIGPFAAGQIPTELAEGALDQTAWRIETGGMTTLQLMAPLRDQIAGAGFGTLFECETLACGGFDFRYGTEILPEPDMHIDLGDYRFLAARRDGPDGPEYLSLIVSRSADLGYVQMTLVGGTSVADLTTSTKSPETLPASPVITPGNALAVDLASGLPVALEDLAFAPGQADVQPGEYTSLSDLAEWMSDNPDTTVALVGHSDGSGNIDKNTALSKDRAKAVMMILVGEYGIDPARLSADGVGPREPRAIEDSDEGRRKNRRVEAISTPTR